MLRLQNVNRSFAQHKAVDNISIHVQAGEFFGLLGPNGAGKTTTITMISGILPPDSGEILVDGQQVYGGSKKVRALMGIVPQEIALYDALHAMDNLLFWGSLYAVPVNQAKERAKYLLEWVGLYDRRNDAVKTYSGGMKRRINIAAALMHDPGLLILDEPTVGIDPQSRNKIYTLLQELHAEGKTIVYTTHYMQEAERMCNRIAIIDHGKIIATGSLQELKQQYAGEERVVVRYKGEPRQPISMYNAMQDADAQTITFSLPQASLHLHAIVKMLQEYHLEIDNMEIHHAGLESIFLHLTGRQLRE